MVAFWGEKKFRAKAMTMIFLGLGIGGKSA
jgi:hypothetical protein